MRTSLLLLIAALGAGCIDDPIAGQAPDLLGATDSGTDGGVLPTLTWQEQRTRITGLRTTGVQTSNNHFYVASSDSGIYDLAANGPTATPFRMPPSRDYALIGVEADLPIISTSAGGLLLANTTPGWSPIGAGLPDGVTATFYLATATHRFVFYPQLGLYRSVSLAESAGFARINQSPNIVGMARHDDESVYLGKGSSGLVTFANASPMMELLVSGTGGLFPVQSLSGGALTLVGGVEGGSSRIKSITGLSASDCGDPIPGDVPVRDVLSVADYNVAIFDNNRVFTNVGCTGQWQGRGTFEGTYQGAGLIIDGANHVLAIGTSHSLYRSSDGGSTLVDVPVESTSVQVTSIAVNPANSAHLVIGTDGRGAWQSLEGGATWTPLDQDDSRARFQLRVAFAAADTLLVAADYNGKATPNGGVFRGVFAGSVWTFERQATVAVGQPPQSASTLLASSTLGLLACFESSKPLQRYLGSGWKELAPLSAGTDCVSIAQADDGATHWIGGTGKILVLHGTNPDALTSETLTVPGGAVVNGITSLDAAGTRILVHTGNGAFVFDGTKGAHEVLFGAIGLSSVTTVYRDDLGGGKTRLWLASSKEPLLVSDDNATSWQRVPTSSGGHPVIYRLLRVDQTLYAATLTNVWRATLP